MTTTCIRRAAWAVVWDATSGAHAYLRDADVVFENDRITFIGKDYAGKADRVFDGQRLCVMPGLVNAHTHLMSECLGRGLIEELGNPNLYMSGLYDLKAVFLATNMTHDTGLGSGEVNSARIATQLAIGELLKSGVTTVVDLAVDYEGWLDTLAETGIRAYAAPMYRQARWRVPTGSCLEYVWDEAKGRRDFEAALTLADAARAHPCGRLDGIVAPAQVDTCTAELLQDSLAAARDRGMRLTIHCAQSVVEFQEMTRRLGMTPVQWLDSIGLLGPEVILGHAMFLDHHSWVRWGTRRDVELIAASGASVAHCPVVFSRYGHMMESVGDYVRAGVNLALGCDTEPHNMLEEMRLALTLGRISSRNVRSVELSDMFMAATVGGARALGREDIGRLSVGAKADLVLVDLDCPAMMPVRDPLRSLVFTAADRAVRHVFVDGQQVLEDGCPTMFDLKQVGRVAEQVQAKIIDNVPHTDTFKRTADQISPMTLAVVGNTD